jgi:hypothetical protein
MIVAIICAAAVAVTAGYSYHQNQSTENTGEKTVDVVPNTQDTQAENTLSTSTDDWKSQFFSNATGTKTVFQTTSKTDSQQDASNTLTDQMSKNLFARIIDLKQNGLDTNQQLVQDTIDQTIDETVDSASKSKKYTTSDITITPNTDQASIRTYADAVATVFMDNAPTQDPATIASNAFDKNDLSLLSQIDPIIAWYKKTISSLLAIPTPRSATQVHLDMINASSQILNVSEALRNIQGDPAQSIIAIGTYTDAQQADIISVENMSAYLNNNHVSFTTQEPGAIFAILNKQLQSK